MGCSLPNLSTLTACTAYFYLCPMLPSPFNSKMTCPSTKHAQSSHLQPGPSLSFLLISLVVPPLQYIVQQHELYLKCCLLLHQNMLNLVLVFWLPRTSSLPKCLFLKAICSAEKNVNAFTRQQNILKDLEEPFQVVQAE